MPIYEFWCSECDSVQEVILPIDDRDNGPEICVTQECPGSPVRIISVTNNNPWDPNRKFPNLRCEGDGCLSFGSQKEYKDHIAGKGWAEETAASKQSKLGHKQVFTTETRPAERPIPGPW